MFNFKLMYEYFAYIGGCLLGIQLMPQIYKTYVQNDASNLSFTFMCCNWIGLTCMDIYAYMNNDLPLVIPISISLFNTSILILLKTYIDSKKQLVVTV